MSNTRAGLEPALYDYVVRTFTREHEVAGRLRAATAPLPMARMLTSPIHGAFLHMLVELIGARRCIEVGVFTGYSALSTALALPDDGRLIACDVNEEWTAIGRRHWAAAGVDHKIDLRLAPARETLDALLAEGAAGTFDMAFIDADKENYELYYERCLALLRAGGVVVVDNVLWRGSVIDDSDQTPSTVAIRTFNERRASDPRVSVAFAGIDDGLSLLRKRG